MFKKLLGGLLILAGLLAGEATAQSTVGEYNTYPRPFTYGGVRSNGWPLIKYVNPAAAPYPPVDSALDMNAIRAIARYPLIAMDMCPIIPWRQDILVEIKKANPSTKIVAYVLAGHYYIGPTADPNVDYLAQVNAAIAATNGILYDTTGVQWLDNYSVNWANKPTADTLLSIWKSRVLPNTKLDGMFLDCIYPSGIGWTTPYGARVLDISRAGYTTKAKFDSAWAANTNRVIGYLKNNYPNKIFILNPGRYISPVDSSAERNRMGRMVEGYPYQELGGNSGASESAKWDTVRAHNVYERAAYSIYKGEHSQISGTLALNSVYGAASMKKARFILGSAALGAGWGHWGNNRELPYTAPAYPTWWFDEYSVAVSDSSQNSVADTTGKNTGWLGMPKDNAVKITSGLGTGLHYRVFENGTVVVNPTTDTLTFVTTTRHKRITGVRDVTVNSGGAANTAFKVNGSDALFLVRVYTPLSNRKRSFISRLLRGF